MTGNVAHCSRLGICTQLGATDKLRAVKKHDAACATDKPLVGIEWVTNHNVVRPVTNGGGSHKANLGNDVLRHKIQAQLAIYSKNVGMLRMLFNHI